MSGTIVNGASAKFVHITLFPLERKPQPVSAKFNRNTVVYVEAAAVCSVELAKVVPPTDNNTLTHKLRPFLWCHTVDGWHHPVKAQPNLKSNVKLEESLTNHDREVYVRNILARRPSVDTPHELTGTSSRTRLHPLVLHDVTYNRQLDNHGEPIGCTAILFTVLV